eukprot:15440194-Alexandrium_andersonii.AAC.1
MPSATKRASIPEVAAGMADIQKGSLYSFVQESSRATFDAAKEVVNNLERGKGPKSSTGYSGFMASFMERLNWAC